MSLYTTVLAQARLTALDALLSALETAKDDPAEVRRIALAIFKAPEPDENIDSALTDSHGSDAHAEPDNPDEGMDSDKACSWPCHGFAAAPDTRLHPSVHIGGNPCKRPPISLSQAPPNHAAPPARVDAAATHPP